MEGIVDGTDGGDGMGRQRILRRDFGSVARRKTRTHCAGIDCREQRH